MSSAGGDPDLDGEHDRGRRGRDDPARSSASQARRAGTRGGTAVLRTPRTSTPAWRHEEDLIATRAEYEPLSTRWRRPSRFERLDRRGHRPFRSGHSAPTERGVSPSPRTREPPPARHGMASGPSAAVAPVVPLLLGRSCRTGTSRTRSGRCPRRTSTNPGEHLVQGHGPPRSAASVKGRNAIAGSPWKARRSAPEPKTRAAANQVRGSRRPSRTHDRPVGREHELQARPPGVADCRQEARPRCRGSRWRESPLRPSCASMSPKVSPSPGQACPAVAFSSLIVVPERAGGDKAGVKVRGQRLPAQVEQVKRDPLTFAAAGVNECPLPEGPGTVSGPSFAAGPR